MRFCILASICAVSWPGHGARCAPPAAAAGPRWVIPFAGSVSGSPIVWTHLLPVVKLEGVSQPRCASMLSWRTIIFSTIALRCQLQVKPSPYIPRLSIQVAQLRVLRCDLGGVDPRMMCHDMRPPLVPVHFFEVDAEHLAVVLRWSAACMHPVHAPMVQVLSSSLIGFASSP